MRRTKTGFTLIELIITICLLGIVLIPLGIISIELMRTLVNTRDSGVAEGLARTEMAKVNNIPYASLASTTITSYDGYPYDLYRTVNVVSGFSDNLKQVQIKIFPAGNTKDLLINEISYAGSFALFGAGTAPASGMANSAVLSSGFVVNTGSRALNGVVMSNIGSGLIMVTRVSTSFTGAGLLRITGIRMAGQLLWSGSVANTLNTTLTSAFSLAAGGVRTRTPLLIFNNRNLTSVTAWVFTMSDGTQSVSYGWY